MNAVGSFNSSRSSTIDFCQFCVTDLPLRLVAMSFDHGQFLRLGQPTKQILNTRKFKYATIAFQQRKTSTISTVCSSDWSLDWSVAWWITSVAALLLSLGTSTSTRHILNKFEILRPQPQQYLVDEMRASDFWHTPSARSRNRAILGQSKYCTL